MAIRLSTVLRGLFVRQSRGVGWVACWVVRQRDNVALSQLRGPTACCVTCVLRKLKYLVACPEASVVDPNKLSILRRKKGDTYLFKISQKIMAHKSSELKMWFKKNVSLFLNVLILIRIPNTDPDPQSCRKLIQFGSGSTTLRES